MRPRRSNRENARGTVLQLRGGWERPPSPTHLFRFLHRMPFDIAVQISIVSRPGTTRTLRAVMRRYGPV